VAAGTWARVTYFCYAMGWYVQAADGWTGYFIKTWARPGSNGAFQTVVLQMGSPGETTSSWYPYLLGGSPAGCTWMSQLWAQTPTGEYHGVWPPPGSTVLYQAQEPIHRSR